MTTAVDLFIDKLKTRTWTSSDAELADVLGVGKSTIASWRKRVSVPNPIIRKAETEYGLKFENVVAEFHYMDWRTNELIDKAFMIALINYAVSLNSPFDVGQLVDSIKAKEEELIRLLYQDLKEEEKKDLGLVGAAKIVLRVKRGEIAKPEAFHKVLNEA